MKKLLKRIVVFFVGFNLAIIAAAMVAKRRLPTYGDKDSDEFALVAAMDGVEFSSQAQALRYGSGTAVAGGMEIDLTEAQPEGTATLDLRAVAGGIDVVVPADWKVEMTSSVIMGGTDNSATKAEGWDLGTGQEASGDPLGRRVDVERAVSDEADDGEPELLSEVDRERRGRRDPGHDGDPGDRGLLHDLERHPARHEQHMVVEGPGVL